MIKTTLTTRIEQVQMAMRKRALLSALMNSILLYASITVLSECVGMLYPWREYSALSTLTIGLLCSLFFFVLRFISAMDQPNKRDIAKQIEVQYPELQDALVCSVEKELIPIGDRNFFEQSMINKALQDTSVMNFEQAAMPVQWRTHHLIKLFIVSSVTFVLALNTHVVHKGWFGFLTTVELIESGLTVIPGDVNVAEHSDVKVEVEVHRWEQTAELVFSDDNGEYSYEMNQRSGSFDLMLYDVVGSVKYKIITPSLTSKWFTISTFTPPTIKNIELKLTPPAYTKRPHLLLNKFDDCSVVVGSTVTITLEGDSPDNSVYLFLNDNEQQIEKIGNKTHQVSFELETTSRVLIRLLSKDKRHFETKTITIEALPDLPPVISIIKPGQDSKTGPSELVQIEARSGDDFAISAVTLYYSVSGQSQQFIPLYSLDSESVTKNINELTSYYVIDPALVGAEAGDIISFYLTVSDNMQPVPQVGRSEVGFIEVREKTKAKKLEGDTKKKEVDINPLIAELKRVIRLSYDAVNAHSTVYDKLHDELKRFMSDLKVETVSIQDQLAQAGDKDIDSLMKKAYQRLEEADVKIRSNVVTQALPDLERALSHMIKIAQKLMSNSTSDKPSDSPPDSQSESEPDAAKKKMDLNAVLQELEQLIVSIKNISDSQGVINTSVKLNASGKIGESELKRLKTKQNIVLDSTNELKLNYLIVDTAAVKSLINNATYEMKRVNRSLESDKNVQARRAGSSAQHSLLNAVDTLVQMKKKIISDQIKKMSDQAKSLADKQTNLAQQSGKAGKTGQTGKTGKAGKAGKEGKEGKDGKEGEAGKPSEQSSKENQAELNQQSKSLKENAELLAAMLERNYPQASKKMTDALADASRKRHDSIMKRAGNALFYKKFPLAEKYQSKSATILKQLGQQFDFARNELPEMTQQELISAMDKMEQAKSQLQAMKGRGDSKTKESLAAVQNEMGKLIKQLSRDLKDQSINTMAMTMEIVKGSPTVEMGIDGAQKVINDTQSLLNNYMLKSAFDKILSLKRKTISTPEQFRNQIDEYFKSLSE